MRAVKITYTAEFTDEIQVPDDVVLDDDNIFDYADFPYNGTGELLDWSWKG